MSKTLQYKASTSTSDASDINLLPNHLTHTYSHRAIYKFRRQTSFVHKFTVFVYNKWII